MLNNKFKALVRKWSALPWEEFRDLLTWDSPSTLQTENSNLLIAAAKNATGKTVCFATAEPIFLVDGYVASPEITPSDLQRGGDAIDSAFAQEAARAGVRRMLIVLPIGAPKERGEEYIRVVERQVTQPLTTTKDVGYLSQSSSVAFLN